LLAIRQIFLFRYVDSAIPSEARLFSQKFSSFVFNDALLCLPVLVITKIVKARLFNSGNKLRQKIKAIIFQWPISVPMYSQLRSKIGFAASASSHNRFLFAYQRLREYRRGDFIGILYFSTIALAG